MIPLFTVGCSSLANPTNGQVSHTGGTTLGQTATYSCNTGYNLVGDSTRTCQSTGVWSGSTPTCQGVFVIVLHCVGGLEAPLLSLSTANHKEYLQVPIRVVRGHPSN